MTGWNGRWHAEAARYPMYDEDQLRSLADSIAANGQRFPCLMTPDGTGIDGRNRVAACDLVGVQPKWEIHDGDPLSLIVDVNAERRIWSTGQKAMAKARRLVEAGQREGGRFRRGSVVDTSGSGNSAWLKRVAEAGVILDWRPDLADEVLTGVKAVDAAYREACQRRDRAGRLEALDPELAALVDSGVVDLAEAERRAQIDARTAALPPDLAQSVHDGDMTLDRAESVVAERAERLRSWAASVTASVAQVRRMVGYPIPADLGALLDPADLDYLTRLLEEAPRG